MKLYVLGLDGAVHHGWMRMGGTAFSSCDDIRALRRLEVTELGFFRRYCPRCFPNRELDVALREVMARRYGT